MNEITRQDYQTIKETFSRFVSAWSNQDFAEERRLWRVGAKGRLNLLPGEAEIDLSLVVRRLRDIISGCGFCRTRIYNFVCRIRGDEAAQYAIVLVKRENAAEFAVACHCVWKKERGLFQMTDLRADAFFVGANGAALWEELGWRQPEAPMPRILGALHSPWARMRESEVVTPEIEAVETLYRFLFGLDHWRLGESAACCSEQFGTGARRYGENRGIRSLLTPIRPARQKTPYWAHPYQIAHVRLEDNRAFLKAYRMTPAPGQRATRRELGGEARAYAVCRVELACEDGVWRIVYGAENLGEFEGCWDSTQDADKGGE